MKNIFKGAGKNGLIYWAVVDGQQIIGTRHAAIRQQFITDKLRKMLATQGVFTEGTTNTGAPAPDLSKIFPTDSSNYNELNDFNMTIDGFRAFFNNDGTAIFANADYIADVETYFDNKHIWKQRSANEPLVYGNNLAIVLPYRVGAGFNGDTASKLDKLRAIILRNAPKLATV